MRLPLRRLLMSALLASPLTAMAGDGPAVASPLTTAPDAVRLTVAKRFPNASIETCTHPATAWVVKLTDAKGEHHTLELNDDGVLQKDNGTDPAAAQHRGGRARLAKR